MQTDERWTGVDSERLEQFVRQAVGDVGATLGTALVVMGDRLGLYRAMAGAGRVTPAELARRTETSERYVREWLNAQAAGGYVSYHADSCRYSLPPEQALALTEPDSPAFLPGFFQAALGSVVGSPRVLGAARSGDGVGWHEHVEDVHVGLDRFASPGYNAHLIDGWLPALDGVVEKLERGAWVADVGCGHGASTILMAQAFPNSTFLGVDDHTDSIRLARERAAEAAVARRVSFRVASAATYEGKGFDLVTMFDALHYMGDPVRAARQVRRSLASEGTWMLVEPAAGDQVEENLHPLGRAFYGFSTLLGTPASLSHDTGYALGAQAGEARLREVLEDGGFTKVRRAAETEFNLVLEARP